MNSKFTKRFLKNKLALFGAIAILILLFISIFGYVIAPDCTENANQQYIALKFKKPGSKINFIKVKNENHNSISDIFFGIKSPQNFLPIEDSTRLENDSFYYKKISQPYFSSIKISSIDMKNSNYDSNLNCKKHILHFTKINSPEIEQRIYFLGTDGLGRDVLSRLIIGARTSMLVGLIAVIISLIIGSSLGMLAGYYGGWIDKIILWLINVFWAIPTVLLAMAMLMAYKGANQFQILIVFLAVGLTMWVDTARLIRGLILQLKERQFVEAGKALGYSDYRILFRHIFPNTFSTLTVITASNFASAILMESGLSYLGLGVQPPTPSWGSMLREYYTYLGTEVSYLAVFPGLCIMLAVFSFYVLGNGLRDAGDVKGE